MILLLTQEVILKYMRHVLCGIVLIMMSALPMWAQIDSVTVRLKEQLRRFPQEKVALHVDRTVLLAGDTVRVKAYVADAATLVPQLDNQFVYVELLDGQKDRMLDRKRLIASNNLYTGYLALPVDLSPSIYYLWAYTLYSAQVKGYDCLVPILVGDQQPAEPKKSTTTKQAIKPVLRFFPEGGYLVESATTMVAFEAMTTAGDTLDISGEIVDGQGRMVSRFTTFHQGRGVFPLKAEKGEHYEATFRDRSGQTFRFPLPQPVGGVASLHCRVKQETVQVSIISSSHSLAPRPLYLLVLCRGRLVRMQAVKAGKNYHLQMSSLPAGVNNLVLVDSECRVLSERLVFSNNASQQMPLHISTEKLSYGLRDSIPLTLQLSDLHTQELAFLSLTVTDNAVDQGRHSPSLWSQLLLASDLQGLSGTLDDYFLPTYQREQLDLLMMVNGWRRYDISQVLQGRYAEPTVEKEHEQYITGRVRRVFANKPVEGAEVVLAITKQNHIDTAKTDSTGHFEFRGLNFPDDAEAFIYALRQKQKRCIVETDRQLMPDKPQLGGSHQRIRVLPWMDIDDELLAQYARDSHLLDEVVVKGHNRVADYENTTLSWDHEKIASGQYPNVGMLLLDTNILWTEPGSERITADEMYGSMTDKFLKHKYSGQASSKQSSSLVKLYVNGMHIPDLTYEDLDINDIDRIDIYLGSKAWVWGEDSSGVLNVTTRSGQVHPNESPFNNRIVNLMGYQQPVDYYFPHYQPGENPQSMAPDLRRTLYWNPYLRMGQGHDLQLSFFSADLPTTYNIWAEGLSSEGRIVSGELKVEIRNIEGTD